MTPEQAAPTKTKMSTGNKIGIGVAIGLACLLACGLIGGALGLGKKDADSAAPIANTATSTVPTPAPASAPPARSAATAPAPSAVAYPDTRCLVAGPQAIAAIAGGLKDGLGIKNATVLESGGLTYFGATLIDPAGKMIERSDVWVQQGNSVYAATTGARNRSSFPKASGAPLNVDLSSDPVQTTDRCVTALTR